MNNYQKIIVALLGVIAASGTVTAYGVMKIAREGFEVELSYQEAKDIEQAAAAAYEDMLNESDEGLNNE